jgi:hypothetical protein
MQAARRPSARRRLARRPHVDRYQAWWAKSLVADDDDQDDTKVRRPADVDILERKLLAIDLNDIIAAVERNKQRKRKPR